MKDLIRNFENTGYYGYLFSVSYNGENFDSFDENPGEKSVKSEFKKLLGQNGIKIFKGIQQAGRTDKYVSAEENILYFNSKEYFGYSDLRCNEISGLKINNVQRTLPFLEFPEMIEKRYYVYEYPEQFIKNSEDKIKLNCENLSGKMDFKKYTSKKGEKLKNHIREIYIEYTDKKLYFEGDGFLPQQVRIMSNFILNGQMKPLDSKYLTLKKVKLSNIMENLIFHDLKKEILESPRENAGYIDTEAIKNIQKNDYFYIFYVNKKDKSRIIGKKGKNIKKLKKVYGNIIIKEKFEIL